MKAFTANKMIITNSYFLCPILFIFHGIIFQNQEKHLWPILNLSCFLQALSTVEM